MVREQLQQVILVVENDYLRTTHDSPSNPLLLQYDRANLARDVADMKEATTKEEMLQIYKEVSN